MNNEIQRLHLDLEKNRPADYRQFMSGQMEVFDVQPGLKCRIDNACVKVPFREVSRMNTRQIMLQFRLKSPSSVLYPEKNRYECLAPHFTLIIMPLGESKTETFEEGQQDVVVTLHCFEGFLHQVLGEDRINLPSWCSKFLEGERVSIHQALPLTSIMREVANEIITKDSTAPLYPLILKSKCLELIWLSFQALRKNDEITSQSLNLSHSDSVQIERVKSHLDNSFPLMPSLKDIAADVGISVWKLNKGFKSMYGLAPSEYFLSLRIEKSQQLLIETQLPVSAIALDVGYDFPTNFSKAFKQYVGVSPREFRSNKLLHQLARGS